MAMVAEMVAMAVVKVLINYYLQKHLEIRKPSSLSMRVCFMAFTREIWVIGQKVLLLMPMELVKY